MFSRDWGVCTIHFEPVVENIKKSILTCQRLLRSMSDLNSGTAHIFRYMMDEPCTFGVILGLCVRMAPMNFPSNVLVSFSNPGAKI